MADRGSPPAPERRYRDDEAWAILERATSRDRNRDLPEPHDATLADLMAAAAEAGLDPAEVRRAAAVEPPRPGGFSDLVFGAPDRREIVASLPGARIPDDTFSMVRRLELALGGRGEVVESAPGLFEWKNEGLINRGGLTLKEVGGALEMTLKADRAGNYIALWFLTLVLWAAASALTPLGTLPFGLKLVGLVVGPLFLARPFWMAADRRLLGRLEDVAMDVLRMSDAGKDDEDPAALPEGEGDGASTA